MGEGEGGPRPGGPQQKARQRGSWMPGGSCPSRWACPPWETATPTRRPGPRSSASGKQSVRVRAGGMHRQTPDPAAPAAAAPSAVSQGKARGKVRVPRGPPGSPEAASAHRKSALSTAAPCRRALTSPLTSDSEGRTGRKAGPRAVRHWTVNVGSGVTDRTGCRDIFNGTDFKAAGHPGKEGVVRPSDGEEKGG